MIMCDGFIFLKNISSCTRILFDGSLAKKTQLAAGYRQLSAADAYFLKPPMVGHPWLFNDCLTLNYSTTGAPKIAADSQVTVQ